jgi:hypothetical protein
MTATQFGAFKNVLFTNSNLETMGIIDSQGQDLLSNLPQELIKTLYNPFQYIASCMWFPFGVGVIANKTSVSDVNMGWWTYTLSAGAYAIRAQKLEFGNETFSFTAHPQAQTRGAYLDYASFSVRYLIGRFGTVALDSFKFRPGDSGKVSYLVDLITGLCIARISVTSVSALTDNRIAERQFLLGVPIQIAQVGTDFVGIAMTANNAIGNTFNGVMGGLRSGGIPGAIVNGIQQTINGIGNTLQSAMPILETSGANGSFLSPANETCYVTMFYTIVDEDIHHRGRPLCEIRQISSLSGFVLCAEGDIDISCYDNERKEITRFLTEGFFWE